MESAIFGLAGVIIGGLLSIAKDWWIQKQNKIKAAEYLSIQVAYALEQYAFHCSDVVNDDGLCYGQPDKDGWYRPQVTRPNFDPKSFDVEWKALPIEFMYDILNFPYKAKLAEDHVANIFKYSDPPDFSYEFEERQWQYASLGIAASELADKLRKHIGLSPRIVGDWDPVSDMKCHKTYIDSQRAKRLPKNTAD